MNNIQFGIDIATSVSLIAAAIAFIYNMSTQADKTREQNRKQYLTRSREEAINDIVEHLESGLDIVRHVAAAQQGRELRITADDYTNFCMRFHDYLEFNANIRLLVWGDETDRRILEDMKRRVRDWNKKFVEAASSRDLKNIPAFNELVDDLKSYAVELSQNLRRAVEDV